MKKCFIIVALFVLPTTLLAAVPGYSLSTSTQNSNLCITVLDGADFKNEDDCLSAISDSVSGSAAGIGAAYGVGILNHVAKLSTSFLNYFNNSILRSDNYNYPDTRTPQLFTYQYLPYQGRPTLPDGREDCHALVNTFSNFDYSLNIDNTTLGDDSMVNKAKDFLGHPFAATYAACLVGVESATSSNYVKNSDNTVFKITNQNLPPCTINCNSNIVFIPGLMGSRLYVDVTSNLNCQAPGGVCVVQKWLPLTDLDIRDLYLNSDGTSVNPKIVTKDVIGTAIGAVPLYKSLLEDMESWKSSGFLQDATSTPYDWRLSIDDVVNKGVRVDGGYISYNQTPANTENPYILDTIIKSASSSKTGKVTLIAHSNGGLVAKAIMQKLKALGKENIVDNLVLVAVPQLGTPDAGVSLLHGDCLGEFAKICTVSDPAETRGITQNMPSAYNLLPSQQFFNTQFVQDVSPLAFHGLANSANAFIYGDEVKDSTKYQDYLKGTDGRTVPSFRDTNNPSIVNSYLLNQANQTHTSLDAWRPASTTKVIEVAGWGKYTIAGLDYETTTGCSTTLSSCVPVLQKTVSEKLTINGDETVVSPSAHYLSTQTGGVDRWWVNLESEKDHTHKNILEVSDIRNLIKDTITHSTSTYNYLTNSETPPISNTPYYSVRVHSPLNLHLYDTLGNHTGLSASGTIEINIPGSQFFQIGEVKTIIAPQSGLTKATLDAYSAGSFTLDQQILVGDTVTSTSQVQAIPTATSTLVTIPLTNTASVQNPILVDFDGNHIIDTTVTPSASSTVVYDVTPPELQLTFSTSTKDVILRGIDNLDPTPSLIVGTSTIFLKDSQNNITTINFKKLKDSPTKLVLTYNTISRNGISTTTPNTRIEYDWALDNQDRLKDLDTKVIIKGIEKCVFSYKKSTNTTTIKVKNVQTGQVTTTARSGFVPVTIITNKLNLLDIWY